MNDHSKHLKFIDQLKQGHSWQLWLGTQFLKEGFFIQVPKLKIRPTLENENIYTDSGDINILIGGHIFNFECKAINMGFTSQIDFPRKEIIVDMVSNWEKKTNVPIAIINISKETRCIFVISTSSESRKEWFIKEIYNGRKDYIAQFYFINKYSKHIKSWNDLILWLTKKSKGGINGI